mmetsp:Transcript_11899/g.24245  ORF Transcript_11899/g.24245 Transcript_11899/m.24245 type:complete len:173 (-) Transcript_11899:2125-2643(-)
MVVVVDSSVSQVVVMGVESTMSDDVVGGLGNGEVERGVVRKVSQDVAGESSDGRQEQNSACNAMIPTSPASSTTEEEEEGGALEGCVDSIPSMHVPRAACEEPQDDSYMERVNALIMAAESAARASWSRSRALQRYRDKRAARSFEKKIRYQSRKCLAESRPRVGGRFVKRK